jgi:hypothetical protein
MMQSGCCGWNTDGKYGGGRSAQCGVTLAGEKLHDAPEGNPEQLKETAELKFPTGVTSIEISALPPASMVRAL